MSESRKHGLLRLRLLDEHTEAVEETMCAERVRFERLKKNESAPRVISAFNLFQTPEPLADRLVGMFGTFGRTLEPSAGLGRIVRAIRKVSSYCHITMVDNAAECCGELYRMTAGDENARLVQGDFLAQTAETLGKFDNIAMNPPFKMGRDITHILHAATLLNPGGRLVSLCAAGPRQIAKLKPIVSEWIDLPPGSFKESFTNVAAAIVVIQK